MTRFEGIIRRLLIAVTVFCLLASVLCMIGAYNSPRTAQRMEDEGIAQEAQAAQCLKRPAGDTAECDELLERANINKRSAISLRRDGNDDTILAWLWPIGALALWLTYFLLRWILTGSVRPKAKVTQPDTAEG